MQQMALWKQQAKRLKRETFALYFAAKDARVPWYAKLLAAFVVGYAFSPVDLIPDFIPVLGLLDDVVLVPLGVALVLRLIPPAVLDDCREKGKTLDEKPKNWFVATLFVLIWVGLGAALLVAAYRKWGAPAAP